MLGNSGKTSPFAQSDEEYSPDDYSHLLIASQLLQFSDVVTNMATNDNNALRYAVQNGHFDVIQALTANNDSLKNAAKNGCLNDVNELLKCPEVVATIAADNYAALRLAAEQGYKPIVKRLFVAIKPAEIKTAIEQNPILAPIYEDFKKEKGEFFHIMVGTLAGLLKQHGVPTDLGKVILTEAIPTPYLTLAKVGTDKAQVVANKYLDVIEKRRKPNT